MVHSGLFSQVILSGPILFFLLGILAKVIRSDLAISDEITKLLSLYVLSAIGIKGGYELARASFTPMSLVYLLIGILGSVVISGIGYLIFSRLLSKANAAAFAATYGSISAMTFITGASVLDRLEIPYGPYMIACMALMEAPAIISAVYLFRSTSRGKKESFFATVHHALTNHSVVLLIGSFIIGSLISTHAWSQVEPFYGKIFYGMLGLFLLDLGLVSAQTFSDLGRAPKKLFPIVILFSFCCALLAAFTVKLIGGGRGDTFLMMLLFGSSSYIAVPAALRSAIPKADVGLYLPMSLGVTFPINIFFGIPLYLWIAQMI